MWRNGYYRPQGSISTGFPTAQLSLDYNVHVKQDKEFINLNEPDIIKDRNCRERRFIEYGKEKSVFTRI